MKRLLAALRRDESGQSLVLAALFLALVGLALLLGGLGAASAYRARAQLQSAADAATLAAAREAAPVVTAEVRVHVRECREETRTRAETRPGPGGVPVTVEESYTVTECVNAPSRSVSVRDPLPLLAGGGWLAAAGCDTTVDLTRLGAWTVCESWRVRSHDGWAYPPGLSSPRRVVELVLASNLSSLVADWEITRFQADDGSGVVRLVVRATLPGNPLASVARRPVTLTVESWARPTGRVVAETP